MLVSPGVSQRSNACLPAPPQVQPAIAVKATALGAGSALATPARKAVTVTGQQARANTAGGASMILL